MNQPGFTLIELSIVLVIIGLLVGGVLVGQNLIHAATTRSVITDVERFNTAAQTFRVKYDCIPGDCNNAATFLGPDPAGCASWPPMLGSSGTCNGNGNGQIDDYTGTAGPSPSNPTYNGEIFLFWHHLSLAHMINGFYNGTGGGDNSSLGSNVPASRVSNACYSVLYMGAGGTAGLGNLLFTPYSMSGHAFSFGGTIGDVCGFESSGSLAPADALNIDMKIDDGNPSTGTVQPLVDIYGGGYNPCVFHGAVFHGAPYSYDTTVSTPVCDLIFKATF